MATSIAPPRHSACRAAPCIAGCRSSACETRGSVRAVRLSLKHENRLLAWALAGGAPALAAALLLLSVAPLAMPLRAASGALIVATWIGLGLVARRAVVRSLQTLSNLLLALREGDFSFRAHVDPQPDTLAEVQLEVNALAETLH